MSRKLRLISLLLCLMFPYANAEEVPSLFYKAEKNGFIVYVLGSIHIGNNDMYPLNDNINNAIKIADKFIFECDTNNFIEVSKARSLMFLNNNISINKLLDEDLLLQVEQTCIDLNISFDNIKSLKPWAIYSIFSLYTAKDKLEGSNTDLAVDKFIKDYAINNKKDLLFAESAFEQYSTLDNLSMKTQVYVLEELVKKNMNQEYSSFDASIDNWPSWYKNNLAKEFVNAYKTDLNDDMAEFHNSLVSKRNKIFAEYIDSQYKKDTIVFSTFGLLHVILPNDSVINELSKRGYEISPIY